MSKVNVRLLLAFFAIYVVWGSTYLAIRVAVETIPPLATAGVRHLVAGLDPLRVGAGLAARASPRTEWRASLVVAVLFFLIGHGTLHWAEQIVPSGDCGAARRHRADVDRDADAAGAGSRWSARMIVGLAAGLIGVALLVPSRGVGAAGRSSCGAWARSWLARCRGRLACATRRPRRCRATRSCARRRRCCAAPCCCSTASAATGEIARVDPSAISGTLAARPRLSDCLWLGPRLFRLHLAARALLGDAGRHAHLRQPCDRGASRLALRRRAADAACARRHRPDPGGGDPAQGRLGETNGGPTGEPLRSHGACGRRRVMAEWPARSFAHESRRASPA